MIQGFTQDLRYSFRALTRRPGIALTAVATMAVGICANSAVFSVVKGVLLEPLPYREPERLVRVWGTSERRLPSRGNVSEMDFLDFRTQNRVFEEMAAFNWTGGGITWTGSDGPERLRVVYATQGFFRVLGVGPVLGRVFASGEDVPGRNRVAVLSHGLWERAFGRRESAVGETVFLSGQAHTVIGVMPPEFRHPEPVPGREPELWLPLAIDIAENNRGGRYLRSIGRLTEGVSFEQAQANLAAIARRLEEQYPDSNVGYGVEIQPLYTSVVGGVQSALLLLWFAVGAVLLIACANVANLFLAGATERQRELTVRVSLGAGRLRIVRQLLTESLVVSLLGGGLGLLLALTATEVLVSLAAGSVPRAENVAVDFHVVGFTLVISVLTGLVFGIVPAVVFSGSGHSADSLKDGGRSATAGARTGRARALLIVCELALSMALVLGSGLLLKSLIQLESVHPGVDTERVVSMDLSLPSTSYPEERTKARFFQQLLERVQVFPGVDSAAVTNYLPIAPGHSCDGFRIDGEPPLPPGQSPCAEYRRISPSYFRVLGIPLLRGRGFEETDNEGSVPVVMIDETLARRFWANDSPIGRHITSHGTSRQIVGVVGAVKLYGLDQEAPPALYVPHVQDPVGWHSLILRSRIEPESLLSLVRQEVQAMDPELPVFNLQTMANVLSRSVAPARFRTLLLGAFASMALLMAATGVYGVVSHSVGQRTQEIGIRMALGAEKTDVLRLIAGQGLLPVAAGLALGLLGALGLGRFLSGLLFQVSSTDPATYLGATIVLVGTACLACYLPARRASKVDPIVSLRYE